jgi:transposase
MGRHELTDAQFALIEPLLPAAPRRGRPWKDHRVVLNGLFWKLNTGVPWRDIPERYGSWQTIYDRYVFWRRNGTWERIMAALQVQLDANGQLDWQQWNVDGTSIRASRAAAGARKKRALTTTNPLTTVSADRVEDLEANSTSSLTGVASRLPPPSRPGRPTKARRLKR